MSGPLVVPLIAAAPPHAIPFARRRCPVTLGVPFARGACPNVSMLGARHPDGAPIPLGAHALEHWPDGSVRWLLADLQVDVERAGAVAAELTAGAGPASAARPMLVTTATTCTTVDAGALTVRATPGSEGLFTLVRPPGAARDVRLDVIADTGPCTVAWHRATVERTGPLRTVLVIDGQVHHGRREFLELRVRLHLFAGVPAVKCDLRVRNPRAAVHPNGQWDLGDPGSVYVRAITLDLPTADTPPGEVWCSLSRESPWAPMAAPLEIYQDSSGGENWRSTNHVNRRREIPLAFRGYRLEAGAEIRHGHRATPIVAMGAGPGRVSLTTEHFWENFPKALEADARGLRLHLFTPQSLDVHELQGGEQKTHTCWIGLGDDPISDVPLAWAREPLILRPEPRYSCATGVVPYLTPEADDPHDDYVALVRAAIEGADTFGAKREVVDEYGWRHFGDIYGDHEAVFHLASAPLVSHYNNQYDAVAGFACQYLRSGDPAWWHQMRELAWHVSDVDVYHTTRDKWAYNGGLFWHTIHYIDADTATHRTYPKSCGHGGGPANEQNYVTGLRLAWLLTGEQEFREAALLLAEFPIRVDRGSSTPFRWLASGDTGLASSSGTPLYHGPGRGSGNSLAALLEGFHLTAEPRFLEKAEQIIRRCVHPADDIASLALLDAERRWFYTMFLQALGRYLDCKQEWGAIDLRYAYARAALLHYARWMADHEYPYLERPEKLEFPTETWAAQDMRKCEVLHYAEKHAGDPAERERFRERAQFFFRASVDALSASPTRTLARPVVILLFTGWMHAWFERHPVTPVAGPPVDPARFGRPERFEPQKRIAVRRARTLAAALVFVTVLGLGGLLLTWL